MPRHRHRASLMETALMALFFWCTKSNKFTSSDFVRISASLRTCFPLPSTSFEVHHKKSFVAHYFNEITFWHFYYYLNVFVCDFSIVGVFLFIYFSPPTPLSFRHQSRLLAITFFTSLPCNGMRTNGCLPARVDKKKYESKSMEATNRLKWFDSNV